MTTSAEAAARAVYDQIKSGDFEGVRNSLAEDCVIEFYGPSLIPYAGIFRGRDNCLKSFDHVKNDGEICEFTQDVFIANEKQVAVAGH